MISAFHGIGAYRGQRNPLALRAALVKCMEIDGEICVADRPIGAFGAVFGGRVSWVFDCDVWSEVSDDGLRECDVDDPDGNHSMSPSAQHEFELFCSSTMVSADTSHYCEAWMTVDCLRAMWVKSWADTATLKAARILAKNRRVPLLTVTGQSRIWDVLDNHNLPFYVAIGE
jgi:hypothetical protein